jgi:hypothetical protein
LCLDNLVYFYPFYFYDKQIVWYYFFRCPSNLNYLTNSYNSLLDIWFFDLDNYPKDILIPALLEIFKPENIITLSTFFTFIKSCIWSNQDWEYTHYIYMFNLDRDIIGKIIKVSYNDSYSYDYIANAIYESIKKNAGFHNRSFFIYIFVTNI